ncbi:adenosylcobinamide-GDP ribazoletransferase [Saccharobesus litoralis]|uniref:Adenosylcobinamide-GDP ribazoletransferase n=1 Tax=Saccharobesus litoralis TaxID=2172099 RepID=A0A2S0VLW4_9ALTE|nr:adenosylcobinamide-GDP ribazoletransferase [Saccharobesus litoralis]AWB65207.1 adenosylcobinamide-GDP ribazoletransferase [Saccharobesus litoralis]
MIKLLKHQVNLFFLALSFFSRIPVPKSTYYSPELLNQSCRYFSLVGCVLAILVIAVYWLFSQILPMLMALLLTFVFSVLLTGAFHEDGLADMADGIGGGMTVEKRLSIMKDSRLGTYGTLTLILAVLIKLTAWYYLAASGLLIIAVLVAYPLSRAIAASLIFDMPYVADSDQSKSKPLANQQRKSDLLLLMLVGCVPLTLLCSSPLFASNIIGLLAVLFVTLWLFRGVFKAWLNARLGGYTGDCLGAAQQLAEIIIYLVCIAFVFQVGIQDPQWLAIGERL